MKTLSLESKDERRHGYFSARQFAQLGFWETF
jgi:hypothetical protein